MAVPSEAVAPHVHVVELELRNEDGEDVVGRLYRAERFGRCLQPRQGRRGITESDIGLLIEKAIKDAKPRVHKDLSIQLKFNSERKDVVLSLAVRMTGCFTGSAVKKLFSILLLAVFGLPLLSPFLAFGAEPDAGLPACCRKNGKHHCMMGTEERSLLAPDGFTATALPEKCPYCPATLTATHPNVRAAPTGQAIFASLVSHPAGVAQVESKRRISQDRSRQKRGPPTPFSL